MKHNLSGKKILVIGPVWPESKSSAAGKRMLQLLQCFKDWGMQIYFGSTAKKSEVSDDLSCYGVTEVELWLNDARTDEVLADLMPDVVMYDRFMIEEQFGWRVTEQCPDAMTILDTEDLHFLRFGRQEMQKKGGEDIEEYLYSERTKRELASILRCDLTLIISEYEYKLLVEKFHILPNALLFIPFMEEEVTSEDIGNWKRYEEREDFVFIGNFIHEPNWQTVLKLKTVIWPLLRKKLPQTRMHIYGAYPSPKVIQLHNEREKFLVHGRADDALEVISDARVMLAPIPFGAGIKGKFIDAMRVGTPSVSSSVGGEAMRGEYEWNGFITDDVEEFVDRAVELYTTESLWKEKQEYGVKLIKANYDSKYYGDLFYRTVNTMFSNLKETRRANFISEVLRHHSVQSSKFFGMWIQEKTSR
ncbi:glycosyltransferase family 4 protein [Myroides odoratimimus]|uniref:glycosyltransferase n=1 Tax=Myroides TaxID=76831 RepID=UPI0008F46018|nr:MULTISPECIES: glycosyltransferase family 4 protein [Myroides]APA92004.1 glycosyltransferase [Myroides sp. ZB35]MCS7471925.1 glycosyltransferase family 4 protein [Myroides odoratimimus]MDM1413345.1 glycosyltransferase family 4 protein [Myroides odoratimimus]MDM1445640.1 glycosyltransferase family 4 protein [Myroides odoratimimus]MDM1510754.1 glycosyltransferase family 4 protein [Myroides odoratimimus]